VIDEKGLRSILLDLESDRIERTISTDKTDKFSQAICAFANDMSKDLRTIVESLSFVALD
jgi:ATP-dependent DNA helicase RecG